MHLHIIHTFYTFLFIYPKPAYSGLLMFEKVCGTIRSIFIEIASIVFKKIYRNIIHHYFG